MDVVLLRLLLVVCGGPLACLVAVTGVLYAARRMSRRVNDLELLIGQMVTDMAAQAQGLDPLRLGLFMNWLGAHSARLKAAPQQQEDMEKNLKPALRSWLASLSVQGMLWEYRLVMDEIAWWRDLDASRLNMILKSESGRRDG